MTGKVPPKKLGSSKAHPKPKSIYKTMYDINHFEDPGQPEISITDSMIDDMSGSYHNYYDQDEIHTAKKDFISSKSKEKLILGRC